MEPSSTDADSNENQSELPINSPETNSEQLDSETYFVDDPNDHELKSELETEAPLFAFSELNLHPKVLDAIKKAGYQTPSPIQQQTVPAIISGRDLIGQAETGSGKTAAFAWPILSRLDLGQTKRPQCLVLAPTRELAIQVTEAFQKYATSMKGFRATTIYGGQSYEAQFRALNRGVHVVVGTPGRVIDHLNRGTLDLSALKVFVLDEADEMLRMGFIDDIELILKQTPGTQQTLFFSATMPPPIQRIAESYLTEPQTVKIKSKSKTADSIEQSYLLVEPRQKLSRLARLLETEDTDGVLVFVKTRNATNIVAESLVQKGVIALPLNGDIPQKQRERTVDQLRKGKVNVMVATDVAARGLDVSRISHVINYDFPHDTEAYVHRIGRTGRAGRTGMAILFVEPKEKRKLFRLQRETKQEIDTFRQKSLKEINRLRISKFKQALAEAKEHPDFEFFQSLVGDIESEQQVSMSEVAACLGVMAQGDSPLRLKAMKTDQPAKRKARDRNVPMQTYRVEVGKTDGVAPRNLVGAITNEAGLTNADIGYIKLFDRFSTVDLPADLPPDVIEHLATVFVNGKQLRLSISDRASPSEHRGQRRNARGRNKPNRDFGRSADRKRGSRTRAPQARRNQSEDQTSKRKPSRGNSEKPRAKTGKKTAKNNVKKYIKIRSAKKK